MRSVSLLAPWWRAITAAARRFDFNDVAGVHLAGEAGGQRLDASVGMDQVLLSWLSVSAASQPRGRDGSTAGQERHCHGRKEFQSPYGAVASGRST